MRCLVVLLALSFTLAGCSADDSLSTDDSFAVGEDHLCEWLTEEQVADVAKDGYAMIGVDDWDGEATVSAEPRPGVPSRIADSCRWSLSEGGFIETRFDRFPLFDWDEVEIMTHEDGARRSTPAPTSTPRS